MNCIRPRIARCIYESQQHVIVGVAFAVYAGGRYKKMEVLGVKQPEGEAYDIHGFLIRAGEEEEEDGRQDRCQGCW